MYSALFWLMKPQRERVTTDDISQILHLKIPENLF